MEISESIFAPENDYLILVNCEPKSLASTCGPKLTEVKGTLLIHYQNCTITINNVTYNNLWNENWDKIHLIPILFNKINQTSVVQTISMKKLQDYHFENRDEIVLLQLKISNHRMMFIYASAAILAITLLFMAYRKYKMNKKYQVKPQEPTVQFITTPNVK